MEIREIPERVEKLRSAFHSGRTRPLAWRLRQLERVRALVASNRPRIHEALAEDLGKPPTEAQISETGALIAEIDLFLKKLPCWVKPVRVSTPLPLFPGRSRIVPEPLGVVLVIAPWNYPFQLALSPLLGAIAAGNCALVKPSEVTPRTSALIAGLVPEFLDRDCFAVFEGGAAETTALLAERFDHIFYTGNGKVGRIVMEAAARHLTPVTLELGGKSPAIVDGEVDLDVAARRIAWGKFFNAGQTCVAPDYVLVHQAVERRLLDRLREAVVAFYGDDPLKSGDFGRIVNERHVLRLARLLSGGELVIGGDFDPAKRYFAPTLLRNVREDAPVMQEEIFGPILPVLAVPDIDAAIAFVNRHPKPLALYLFSTRGEVQRRVIAETSSGGVAVNHTLLQLSVPGLPFGGVGESGIGAYHGQASFDTFSHRKAVLTKGFAFDWPLLYPPYGEAKRRWLSRLQ